MCSILHNSFSLSMSPTYLSSKQSSSISSHFDYGHLGWKHFYCAVRTEFSSPMFFVGCRFAVAALTLLLISLKSMKGVTLKDLGAGSVIGLRHCSWLWHADNWPANYSSSESAFLTALYVPLVPYFQCGSYLEKLHIS